MGAKLGRAFPGLTGSYRALPAGSKGAFETSPKCKNGEVSKTGKGAKNTGNRADKENGTALAIKYDTSGGGQLFAPRSGRGGARNRSDRTSEALSASQINNLIEAVRHADAIGLPLTRFVTVHWQAAGMRLEEMAKATGRFIDLATRALARHGARTAVIWVHESGEGKGGHAHILMHVPANLVPVLSKLQRKWIRAITGQPYRARVIFSEPVGGRLGLEVNAPELHAINLGASLEYLLKGADADAAAMSGLTRLESGGRIIGKRCGWSENIGAKARASYKQS